MKFTRYTKYVPDAAGDMSLEDLMNALSDYLLQSGFQDALMRFSELPSEQSIDELKEAIRQALEMDPGLLNDETREMLDQLDQNGEMDDFIESLIDA